MRVCLFNQQCYSLLQVYFIWEESDEHNHEHENYQSKDGHKNFLEKTDDETSLTFANFLNFFVGREDPSFLLSCYRVN